MKQIKIFIPILLLLLSSCFPSSYTTKRTLTSYSAVYDMSLSKVERPEKASSRYGQQKIDSLTDNKKYRFIFEDDMVRVLWSVDSCSIAFSVQNKTDHSIKLPWDESAFIDENGSSHRVMHSGVKYTDRANPQAPSIIARKASIEDIVSPTDYVQYVEGIGWQELPFFPSHDNSLRKSYSSFNSFETSTKSKVGKTYQVLLPLQIEDVINDYIFTFTVDKVTCSQETREY